MLLKRNRKILVNFVVLATLLSLVAMRIAAFPAAAPEDERYMEREFGTPGGHQLASWLIAKLRQNGGIGDDNDDIIVDDNGLQPLSHRLPLAGKRNSELTSVMLGFPKSMIDNGRK